MSKSVIREDACMKFYDETQPLYLETDASGAGIREFPFYKPEVLRLIAFASKSLSSAERRYRNIEILTPYRQ